MSILVMANACGGFDAAATDHAGDFTSSDMDSDSIPEAESLDGRSDSLYEADMNGPVCLLDELIEHSLSTAVEETSLDAWLVVYHEGILVGRVRQGEHAMRPCFEMFWERVECTPDRAKIHVFSPCRIHDEPVQEFDLTFQRSTEVVDGFSRVLVEGIRFEILYIFLPSNVDAACDAYDCTSTLPDL